jgi:hypothetical protein
LEQKLWQQKLWRQQKQQKQQQWQQQWQRGRRRRRGSVARCVCFFSSSCLFFGLRVFEALISSSAFVSFVFAFQFWHQQQQQQKKSCLIQLLSI